MAHAVTDSAVTEAALREYLEREGVDEDLVVRRMDGVTHAVAQLQHDVDVLSQAFGMVVRYSFRAPPPPAPAGAIKRADVLYAEFLAGISKQLGEGARFAGDVRRARKDVSAATTGPGT
jgi:hypothetical protein